MSDNPKLAEQALALRLEQAQRWRNHDRAPAEAYLAQQPELYINPEYALEVIYGELLLREEEGETPLPEEFLQRFPQFALQLQQLFEVHTPWARAISWLPNPPRPRLGPPGRNWLATRHLMICRRRLATTCWGRN